MDLALYEKAKQELLTASNEGCRQFFVSNNCNLELAYSYLLAQEPQKAQKLFLSLIECDIRAHWGAFLTSLCCEKIEGYVSYLELRNFFEIDFNLFFANYLGAYIESVCKYADWLAVTNPEIYKYIGRVFLKNGYVDFGLFYLEKGINSFYNDPELHYLLAEYFYSIFDYQKSLKYVKSCIGVLPGYYPAEKLYSNIVSRL